MEHLIEKYLSNELSREEWVELRRWFDQDPTNKTTFYTLVSNQANINNEISEFEEAVWMELSEKKTSTEFSFNQSRYNWYNNYYKVAVILILVTTFSIVFHQIILKGKPEIPAVSILERNAPTGSKLITRLPDESIVTLNAGSTITFPEQFTGNLREVTLTGEAFFEVVRDPDKPFIVDMNGHKVQVLGTSFSIRSYSEENSVSVSVATGRVRYTIPSGEAVTLIPEQMATYQPGQDSLFTGKVDMLKAFGWKDRMLYFKSASFNEIVAELNRWYGVEIVFEDDFSKDGTYTSEFDDPTLMEVLNSLSFVYRFEYKINGNEVYIGKQS